MGRINQSKRLGENRAQVLLAGSFILAVLLLVLAVVFNGTIQVGLTATHDTDPARASLNFQEDARQSLTEILINVNTNSAPPYSTALTEHVNEYNSLQARLSGEQNTATLVELSGSPDLGDRIYQNTSRNFSAANGNKTWTLAKNVDRTRAFELNVSNSELEGCPNCFKITADSGATVYNLSIGSSPNGIKVDGGAGGCSINTTTARIHVTEGTLESAASSCKFDPLPSTLNDYNISYIRGDKVTGTYELVIEGDPIVDDRYNGNPTFSSAVYAANFTVTYSTPRVTYTTTFKIAPSDRSD